ncbi:DUF4355 domain-containing protein [Candidatus Enterococcus ikei]|uniref:DUF4355 domain-containing protein n=1 Tax=Candidatus Enterococcus ikei TaxID=2815326 RepID=A0ABS3GUM8_9ENTE|nr:DUF4355 domain-containing protein [Enterococcus sp. DIV0869a]MBO0438962.1 DUF4355 domain-containing protein [Enterococcus sp. DIV0869a]
MKITKLRMNLQFFAEDAGSNSGGDNPDNATNGEIVEKLEDEQETNESDKKYSDEDVNKIIDAKFAKWKSEQQKEQDEAKKLAEMDEKEKTDYEKQKLQAEIDALKKEKTLVEMANTATSMLADKGIKANEGILSFVVKDSAEGTSESVKTFVDLINVEREAIKEDFEKRLGSKMPLDGTTSTTLSRGAQMAKEINNQTKKPELDPWATN